MFDGESATSYASKSVEYTTVLFILIPHKLPLKYWKFKKLYGIYYPSYFHLPVFTLYIFDMGG